MSHYKSGNDYGSSMTGPQHTLPYLNNVFPNRWIGRGGPVQWTSRSPDLTPMDFFIWGKMMFLVYETPIDTPEELVAHIAEAAAIIHETQSFAR